MTDDETIGMLAKVEVASCMRERRELAPELVKAYYAANHVGPKGMLKLIRLELVVWNGRSHVLTDKGRVMLAARVSL